MVGKMMDEIAFYANGCNYGYLLKCKYYRRCPCTNSFYTRPC